MSQLERFIKYLSVEKQASNHTIDGYRLDIQQFIELLADGDENFDNWGKFDRDDARSYLQELHKLSLSKNSISRKLASMRSFYKFLLLEGVVKSNPFMRLPAMGRERKLPQVMSLGAIERLINAVEPYWRDQLARGLAKNEEIAAFILARDKALIEVIYSGGLRIGEAVGLNFKDVDILGGSVLVHGKGKKERLCALGRPARTALRSYLQQRRLRSPMETPTSPVFINRNCGRLNARSFQRNLKAYLLEFFGDARCHRRGNIFAVIRAQIGDLFDQTRTDKGVIGRGHHKDSFAIITQTAVHQSHLQLVFKVRKSPQTAQYGIGLIFFYSVNHQSAYRYSPHIGISCTARFDHFHAFFDSKHGVFFAVDRHRYDHPVKEFAGADDQVKMSVGQRVKAPGIKYITHYYKPLLPDA